MSAREKFGKWMASPFTVAELSPKDGAVGEPHAGAFDYADESFLFLLWQASRAVALEEAAAMVSVYLADHSVEQATECLPDAIRALAKDGVDILP